MSVDWAGYTPLRPDPQAARPLAEVPRPVAEGFFRQFLDSRQERIEALRALLSANGRALSDSDGGIQELEDWYRREVKGNEARTALTSQWYAVAVDIGIFLGEALIARAPHLKWTLFVDGRKDASFQRPVIMGFRGVKNPRYNVDFPRLVAMCGHRVIEGDEPEGNHFVSMLKSAIERA